MKKLALLAVLAMALPASAAVYDIDVPHSSVNFKVRHMVVSKTKGSFAKFSGVINYDAKNPKSWSVEAEIDAASIDTDNSGRDDHLRSADFFDAAKFPKITFKSKAVKSVKGSKAVLVGDLTLKGVTKEVSLDLEANGEVKDPKGVMRAGFTATTKINRMDYGITWSKKLDTGGLMVGDEVEINIEIEAIAQSK